jgi:Restriction endonuclease
MTLEDVKRRLAETAARYQDDEDDRENDDGEPEFLSPDEIEGLKATDLPAGVHVQVGRLHDAVHRVEFDGTLTRGTKTPIRVEMTPSWYRKYWPLPLGMGPYVDLVRRAIETRQRVRGDVDLGDLDSDDDIWIHLTYTIHLPTDDVAHAYAEAKRIDAELFEAADAVCDKIDLQVAEVGKRLSGWGQLTLDQLLDEIDRQKTMDAKGRVLEELVCKLLETVPGFRVGGRVRTETEEIDIRVINGSEDPVWKREGALLLVECKNWSSKCSKDEVVLFEEKLRNRRSRCSCGLLISWNGFAKTVTKELLRGSTGDLVIIPIDGKNLRTAVRDGSFVSILAHLWESATLT